MSTQESVLKIFMIYIFIKALILCPMGWVTLCLWWNDRKGEGHDGATENFLPANSDEVQLTPQPEAA